MLLSLCNLVFKKNVVLSIVIASFFGLQVEAARYPWTHRGDNMYLSNQAELILVTKHHGERKIALYPPDAEQYYNYLDQLHSNDQILRKDFNSNHLLLSLRISYKAPGISGLQDKVFSLCMREEDNSFFFKDNADSSQYCLVDFYNHASQEWTEEPVEDLQGGVKAKFVTCASLWPDCDNRSHSEAAAIGFMNGKKNLFVKAIEQLPVNSKVKLLQIGFHSYLDFCKDCENMIKYFQNEFKTHLVTYLKENLPENYFLASKKKEKSDQILFLSTGFNVRPYKYNAYFFGPEDAEQEHTLFGYFFQHYYPYAGKISCAPSKQGDFRLLTFLKEATPLLSSSEIDQTVFGNDPNFKIPLVETELIEDMEDDIVTEAPIEQIQLRTQPFYDAAKWTGKNLSDLTQRANEGDKDAQDQIIEGFYWGFVQYTQEKGRFGLKVSTWDDIENRAILDDRYAYALIHSYEHVLRWLFRGIGRKPFVETFPKLFKAIQEGAERNDPNAQFLFGILHLELQNIVATGSEIPPAEYRAAALKWVKSAADQGHLRALISLGYMVQHGNPEGRSEVEALRWCFASQETKISQDALKTKLLIVKDSALEKANQDARKNRLLSVEQIALQKENTFKEKLQQDIEKLIFLVDSHKFQKELHNPDGGQFENQLAIPQFAELYENLLGFEIEAGEFLTMLQKARPGFMVNDIMIREIRSRETLINMQTEPHYASVSKFQGAEYLNLGEENVKMAKQLLSYSAEIDEKFVIAEKALKKIKKYYKIALDASLSKLARARLVALKFQDEASVLKFKKKEERLKEDELIFRPLLNAAKNERMILVEVKNNIKNLIAGNVSNRNADFFEAYPFFLKP
ncbi:MAG: hypothetical protein Q8L85_06710 [Alphaproteobacteria bacterium]|nr:hypothetical protein [Alphaproteobacteria bacterium]